MAGERYSEEYLRRSVRERCENLGVDSVDVLLLHTWTRAWNDRPYPLDDAPRLVALIDEGNDVVTASPWQPGVLLKSAIGLASISTSCTAKFVQLSESNIVRVTV